MLRSRALFAFFAALAGCSGGGSALPGAPAPPSGQPASTQSVRISIFVPVPAAATAAGRRTAHVSSQTQSAVITVNGGTPALINLATGAPSCSVSANGRTCTTMVSAPAGIDVFSEKLYATTDGTGAVLSTGTTTAKIVAGVANSVTLTLSGVPASVVLGIANATPAQGASVKISLTATVRDASGAAIVGADPFTTPITLTDSDTSGTTSLSKTTLTSASDAADLSVTYTGAALAAPAIFGATGAGIADVTTVALTPQTTVSAGGFNNYTTYGFDNQRTKFNPNSTAITPSTLTPGSATRLHLAWQASLSNHGEYNTQTQPIIATNIPGHTAVMFVGAGGSGNLYAYDALSGTMIWSINLGLEQYACNESQAGPSNFGIGGTVAYDVGSMSLYVVGNANSGPGTTGQNTLWHINAATGQTLGSVNFAPTVLGPSELNFSHTSVTLNAGIAYVGTAATCDISSWRGRVASVSVPSMTLMNTFYTVWDPATQWGGGGVWGYGGVSLDFNGNVYTGVGNTDNGTTAHGTIVAPFQRAPSEDAGYGDAFLAISPDLGQVLSANHPIPNATFGSTTLAVDLDLNGTPAIFKPSGIGCNTLAAVQGKSGALYIYDTTNIGRGPLQSFQLSPPSYNDEFLGDPAYSPVTGFVYSPIPVGQGSLYPPGMVAINPGCGAPTIAWHTQFGPDSDASADGVARSAPAVSSGGVVFVGTPCFADTAGGCTGNLPVTTNAVERVAQSVRKPAICCNPPNSGLGGAVWALDAGTGAVLNGGVPLLTTPNPIRVPPTIDGNWVYVLDNGGNMFGFTIDGSVPAIAGKARASDARARAKWQAQPKAVKSGS